jgi:hypothetical protein
MTGRQSSGFRKFWLPGSPECTFTATLPVRFPPTVRYIESTCSGVILLEKYTFALIFYPPLICFFSSGWDFLQKSSNFARFLYYITIFLKIKYKIFEE